MTESPVDVAAIKAAHRGRTEEGITFHGLCPRNAWPCEPYRLADKLDRAQAASEGVDMLISQAERRGAVKALHALSMKAESEGNYATALIAQAASDELREVAP